MPKDYFNFNETFCDAVDIIVSEKLKQLSYDITKVCIITDDTHKKLGKYTVKEDVINYDAYSSNINYEIGDAVLVSIPNGDYSMQKTIISKAVIEEDLTTSVAYVSPLQNFLDFTGNIVPLKYQNEYSLLANHPTKTMQLICAIDNWSSYTAYDLMAISVDFQTWLSEFNTQSGSYGLLFYFYQNSATLTTDIEEKKGISFIFNINDFIGNPYYFETFFNQEKLIDISHLTNIARLEIYFYQNKDFKDYDGQLIPYLNNNEEDEFFENIQIEYLEPNLFLKNLNICLGYNITNFSGDELRLSVDEDLYYSKVASREKTLNLNWIHKLNNNKYIALDDDNSDKEIELYWIHSSNTTQATISHIVGNYWIEQDFSFKNGSKFKEIILNLDKDSDLVNQQEISVRVVGRIKEDNGSWSQYISNTLTFKSTDTYVDETTYNAATGLAIVCKDGSEGNYLIYDQTGEIINEGQGQGYNRTFEIRYKNKTLENSELASDISNVKWYLPYNSSLNNAYTMLTYKLEDLNLEEAPESNELIITKTSEVNNNFNQNYSILNTWYISNAHNKVVCEVNTKTGPTYKASKELIFGKANSQGSNLSIIIQYDNNKNAYEIFTDNNNNVNSAPSMLMKGLIYDLSGKLVSSDQGAWNWELNKNDNFSLSFTGNQCTISLKNTVDNVEKISYNIIKVTYQENERTIETYFPVAIKTIKTDNKPRCTSMEGARKIIYNAFGSPTYYNDIYKLYDDNSEIKSVQWRINEGQYYPTLKDVNRDNINYKALQANPVFMNDYDYSVYITAGVEEDNKFIIYWIQPILIMQSDYNFAIINEWSGETKTNDESIVSSVIAAGNKEEGAFSGIILGDIKDDIESDLVHTGLYGVNKGAITFSLTDSGLATFENKEKKSLVLLGAENLLSSFSDDLGQKNLLDFNLDNQMINFQEDIASSNKLVLQAKDPYLELKGGCVLESANNNLKIDLANNKIEATSASLSWAGNDIYIGTIANGNDYVLKMGDLTIKSNGGVYYKNQDLASYIDAKIAASKK